MLSSNIRDKMHIMHVISNNYTSAIVLELMNARDAGKSPVPHKELLWLVDVNIAGAATLYWQQSMRELEQLGMIEILVEDGKAYGPDTISYQLNPHMGPFCAELLKLLFDGEKGSRDKLPPEPHPGTQTKAPIQS
jgi:hypothetical protein